MSVAKLYDQKEITTILADSLTEDNETIIKMGELLKHITHIEKLFEILLIPSQYLNSNNNVCVRTGCVPNADNECTRCGQKLYNKIISFTEKFEIEACIFTILYYIDDLLRLSLFSASDLNKISKKLTNYVRIYRQNYHKTRDAIGYMYDPKDGNAIKLLIKNLQDFAKKEFEKEAEESYGSDDDYDDKYGSDDDY